MSAGGPPSPASGALRPLDSSGIAAARDPADRPIRRILSWRRWGRWLRLGYRSFGRSFAFGGLGVWMFTVGLLRQLCVGRGPHVPLHAHWAFDFRVFDLPGQNFGGWVRRVAVCGREFRGYRWTLPRWRGVPRRCSRRPPRNATIKSALMEGLPQTGRPRIGGLSIQWLLEGAGSN